MREMPVEGSVAASKGEHRPGDRRYFLCVILDIISAAQQPQPTLRTIPSRVQVKQQRDDLGLGIGVNAPVFAVALAAHGQDRRTALEIDFKFLFDRKAQRRPGQRRYEPRKGRPRLEKINRKTSV